jgi:hypothetical protein
MAARCSASRRLGAALPAFVMLLAVFVSGCGATVVTGVTSTDTVTPTGAATGAPTGAPTATPANTGGQQTPPATGPHGTLSVDVLAGPTCPVEQVENPCPPAHVTNRPVTISRPDGVVVATTTTDARGHFNIALAPGAYVIRVAIVPGEVGLRQDSSGDVTMIAGQTTAVQIMLDTGIR